MKSLGIFLGFPPGVPLRKEGIGRLVAFMLKGTLSTNRVRVSIAAPRWLKKDIEELLDDHQIDSASIDFIFTKGLPSALVLRRVVEYLGARRPRQGNIFVRLRRRLRRFGWKLLVDIGSSSSLREISPHLLKAVLLFPLIVTFSLLYAAARLSANVFRAAARGISPDARGLRHIFTRPLISFRLALWAQDVYREIQSREFERLIALINERVDIPVWFVPSLIWPETAKIKTPRIVAVPDIVFFQFAAQFSDSTAERVYVKIVDSIRNANKLVCYSEHVKKQHLVDALGVAPSKIGVIGHGRTSMRPYLKSTNGSTADSAVRGSAIQIMRSYQQFDMESDGFWKSLKFEDTEFVFYSSQLRPYKNILNLVKAIKKINRENNRNVKLVITANISAFPQIADFIKDERMEHEVLSIHDVPSKVVAALYALAALAVNPSLFEGGFPFTFCEAYSVGTPSLMSDIPVVGEVVVEPGLRRTMLFDPFNVEEMTDRIMWGLDNRVELKQAQAELFASFPSWDAVASNYVDYILQPSPSPALQLS